MACARRAAGRLAWLWLVGMLAASPGFALEITRAEGRGDAAQAWQQIVLPDHWPDARRGYGGAYWYRLTVPLESADGLRGIFLKRVCANAWIYANGQLIHSGGGPESGARVSRRCHFPVLAAWPRGAQRAGDNEILIRVYSPASTHVASEQRVGHLSTVLVDDWESLRPLFEREYFSRILWSQVLSALMAFAGLTLLVLWWRYRRESIYLHFGLVMALSGLATARVFWADTGLEDVTVERTILSMALVLTTLFSGSMTVFAGMRSRLYPRPAWELTLLFLGLIWLAPSHLLSAGALVVFAVMVAMVVLSVAEMLLKLHGVQRRAIRAIALAGFAIGACGVHDYLIQIRVLTYSDRPLIQIVLPLLLLVLLLEVLSRYAWALRSAEAARGDLERRVQLITAEIEASYRRSVSLEKERSTQEERERIARDLHDDLGARLLTLAHRSTDEKTSESAREALSDLRLLIGQLNQLESGLLDSLADWRAEVSERCDAAGRVLHWDSGEVQDRVLGARQKITLARVLREAVTNIIKHAGCSDVFVAVHGDADTLVIEVADRQASAPVDSWRPGTGMTSLRTRAAQIGATLCWSDVPGADGAKAGTALRCIVPTRSLAG